MPRLNSLTFSKCLSTIWFLRFLSLISCKTGCFVALITPSKGRDWKKNSTLTQPNPWKSYLTLQLLGIWICSGKQPDEQMWLWLLSLLFDQTVTTENTSTFLDGDVLCSSALGFCCTNAMTSSIDIQNIFYVNHTSFIRNVLKTSMSEDVMINFWTCLIPLHSFDLP